jgi:putative ABC transport system permease protein
VTLTGLAFRNLSRNRFRVVLTVLGVAVAILTFVLLRTVVESWTSGAQLAAKDRVVTRHKVTFVMTLPKHYFDVVSSAPHVKKATFANWFGGKDPNHDREFFATLGVDTNTYFDVYPEFSVSPEVLSAWKDDRKGAIIGDILAKKLGWKVGDRITLQSGIFGGDWQFDIVGIYTATAKSVDRQTFLFHWELLNEAIPAGSAARDQVGWIVSKVDDPAHAADVGVSIDSIFDEKDIQTLSADEGSFNASFLAGFSAVLRAIDIISLVILVIMMLILGNTIAMGVRERTNEYGVLRALGFLPKHIATFVLSEAMFLGLFGGLLGVALSYPIVDKGLGGWLLENMGGMFRRFGVEPMTAVIAVLLAIALAGIAAIIPANNARRLRVIDALRRVA